MQFSADTMFPGDLFEAASRFASDAVARGDRHDAWRQAAAMGWPALLVDEAHGGAGGTLADLGAVIEGCSRQALGLPLVRRCAQAPALLMAASAQTRSETADEALRALCAGEIDLDVVDGTSLSATPLAGGGLRLAGTLEAVDAELPFTHVLVATGEHLLLLPQATLQAASRTAYAGIDGARIADHTVTGLELPASAVLQSGPAARQAAATAQDLAMLATTLDMAATLGASIEHCIAYLSARVQFGVALASFQVLRHKVVELYVDYESASVLLARLVADTVASGRLASRDAMLCKLYLNELARRGAEASIQLHGGMGMTAELPAARLARRLLCAEFEQGDRFTQLSRLQSLPTAALA
ncbi:MAG: acyl-CoA/acyl-ACP dehydrogenase [Burkholderiaceae bacterium]|nr:acyl-CoA/acyl-ACP dehydrogenase [Burkholderiaceae bacterium]